MILTNAAPVSTLTRLSRASVRSVCFRTARPAAPTTLLCAVNVCRALLTRTVRAMSASPPTAKSAARMILTPAANAHPVSSLCWGTVARVVPYPTVRLVVNMTRADAVLAMTALLM